MSNEGDLRQKLINDMTDSIPLMKLTERQRELVKAAFRFAIEFANKRAA